MSNHNRGAVAAGDSRWEPPGINDNQEATAPSDSTITETRPWAALSRESRQRRRPQLWKLLKKRGRRLAQKRSFFKMKDLQYSPALVLLAIWHTFGVWITFCIYVTMSANLLLSWYIDWYRQSNEICGESGPRCGYQEMLHFPIGPFFAIFLRSWCLVCVVAELMRFCYLVALDAWRVDAFEAYRQAACGELYAQWIETQCLQNQGDASATSCGWSSRMLTSQTRFIDKIVQLCLYASLDVVPFVLGIWSYSKEKDVQFALLTVTVSLTLAICFHTIMYFLAWNITDVAVKVKTFRLALREELALQPRQYPGENLGALRWAGSFGDRHLCNLEDARCLSQEQAPSQFVSFAEPGGDSKLDSSAVNLNSLANSEISACSDVAELGAGPSVMPPALSVSSSSLNSATQPNRVISNGLLSRASSRRHTRAISLDSVRPTVAESEAQFEAVRAMPGSNAAGDGEKVAEKLNVCVPICGWLRGLLAEVLPHFFWVTVIVVGWLLSNIGLILTGVFLLLIILCRHCCSAAEWHQRTWSCPLCWGGGSWKLWALQAWGETYCALSREVQSSSRVTFGTVVLLQGVLFAALEQWAGLAVCTATFACIVLRQLSDGMDRPWGWLLGILESLLLAVGASLLNYTTFGLRWAFATLLLASVRQFGLARFHTKGFQVARFTTLLLNTVLVMVVVVVVLTMAYSGVGTDYSAFKDADVSHTFYAVPPFPKNNLSSGLACEGRFLLGSRNDGRLSLSDFGLFAAIAYESDESIDRALGHYFPGWQRTYSRREAGVKREHSVSDWTTFFEFTDPYNSTTVFTIRGTSSMLDILDDINIWAPAAIMQLFSAAGPGVSGSSARAVALLSTLIYGESMQKAYFSQLLSHVQEQKKQWPDRRFYLAGHSLGGGLAKLVASQVDIQAVTFMAPGLATTSYVVFGQVLDEQLRHDVLTVMPNEDVVSRVDSQEGIVINVDCAGGPLACHSIYNTICTIVDICGSGRRARGTSLTLPCGVCESRPCPTQGGAGVAASVF